MDDEIAVKTAKNGFETAQYRSKWTKNDDIG